MADRATLAARFLPLILASLGLAAGVAYTRARPDSYDYHFEFVLALLVWVLTSSALAFGVAPRRLARRVTAARPWQLGVVTIGVAAGVACVALPQLRGVIPTAWVPLGLAALHAVACAREPWAGSLRVAGFGLAVALLLEGSFALLPRIPALGAPSAPSLIRQLYLSDAPKLLVSCGQGDPDLSYVLRPGRCSFGGLEFQTTLENNRLGVRDDEASLDAPEVIVLGDSYAMGWGVEQDESYASQLETQGGFRVLNAGIGSYGTARQIRLLERIDLRRARTVLIQYCANDFAENREWTSSGGALPSRDLAWFDDVVEQQRASRSYWPLKYTRVVWHRLLLPRVRRTFYALGWPGPRLNQSERGLGRRAEAEMAARILAASPHLADLDVIVFELNFYEGHPGPSFLESLQELATSEEYRDALSRVRVVDVMSQLEPELYFRLDTHLNAAGHERVAELLLPMLDDSEAGSGGN
jgi:lysophospholipase L1-like esterase